MKIELNGDRAIACFDDGSSSLVTVDSFLLLEVLKEVKEIKKCLVEPKESAKEVMKEAVTLNLNTATSKELAELPTIGRVTAKEIIGARPFDDMEEAKEKLPGLKWEEIKGLVSI